MEPPYKTMCRDYLRKYIAQMDENVQQSRDIFIDL